MTWEPGRDRVQQLIDDGEVERVAPDVELARWRMRGATLLAHRLRRRPVTCLVPTSWPMTLSGRALRACWKLRGCVQPAEAAILPYKKPSPPSSAPLCASSGLLAGFAGHETVFEYPSSNTLGPSAEDVDDAVKVATEAYSAAGTILDQDLLTPW
jgi:hypothetical protein